jgi:hypothetical protein
MVVGTNKCTSVVGHFNGHAEALKQYIWNCLMQHVQGYSGSHWMLPSDNHSLRIALAAARATANKSSMTNVLTLMAISAPVDMLAPNNNRGMTYQTDEKHLTIFPEHFVGVVKLTHYYYVTHFHDVSLPIISLNIHNSDIEKTHEMLCLRVFGPPRLAP